MRGWVGGLGLLLQAGQAQRPRDGKELDNSANYLKVHVIGE